ncbi:hypothetical protein AB4251_17985 [Vibrio lentus]|uniref:Uncharacterized protein n=1 Tax=Vibrio lentus TaxID=136468 RepID=A0AB36XNB6_9VIBR|nr:hypothetical protein [Vibrio lentus]MCC4839866.1 hypothetical protein [Vibrio lentus]PMI15860.1 hypothetical protein BCU51_15195 [Vibrio lentus]PMK30908.1 hypothetical protein BCU02_02900 [Vibrio lentus]PMK47308.1 hypothetical protein BCT99_18020 [Vibrio lentus]PML28852.1 hypothetical protein BCT79_25670 [Vibrio lentus]
MTAGIIGAFLGYWLLHAADALIFKPLESGDLATWFAAAGTILTLAFLINQHRKTWQAQKVEKEERKKAEAKQEKDLALEREARQKYQEKQLELLKEEREARERSELLQREELKKEREARERHEAKQQEMWQKQSTMFAFQKYQDHKSLLLELLSELDNQHSVTIHDKSKFYRKVFIKNNSEHCDLTITPQSRHFGLSQLGVLDTIYRDLQSFFISFKDMQLSTAASLEADIAGKIYDGYLTKLYQFSQALHVELEMPISIGNVHLHGQPNRSISNIFIAERSFKTLEAIYISIAHFCGNEVKEFKDLESTGFSLAKIYHFFDNAHHHHFTSRLAELKNDLYLLWEYLHLLSHDDILDSAEVDRDIIITFFNDSENYELSENNLAHLPTILQTLYESNKGTPLDNGLHELNQRCKERLMQYGVYTQH